MSMCHLYRQSPNDVSQTLQKHSQTLNKYNMCKTKSKLLNITLFTNEVLLQIFAHLYVYGHYDQTVDFHNFLF